MKTLNLAVVGKDVSKSASPKMHKFIAEHMGNKVNYTCVSYSEAEFEYSAPMLFRDFDGFNVTIPFKLDIIQYLGDIVGDAKVFGAVNTVKSKDKTGYNTDGLGFMLMLTNNGIDVSGKEVLLLGAGGAGRSVAKKLKDAGANVSVYDPRYENCLAITAEFGHGITPLDRLDVKPYFAIINASGIGMHKTEGISPVDDKMLNLCEVAVDLIYVPKTSEFLKIAGRLGKKTVNGEAMLFYQAYYAECIYFDVTPDEQQAKQLFEKYTEANL